jgi:hypothetical protein
MSHWRAPVSPISATDFSDVSVLEVQAAFESIRQHCRLSQHVAAAESWVSTLRRAAESFVEATRVPKAWTA